MPKYSWLLCVSLFCVVGSFAAEIGVGSTREEVIAQLGEPKSTMKAGGREILGYPNGRVTLTDQRVVSIDLKSGMPAPAKDPVPARPSVAPKVNKPSAAPRPVRAVAREEWLTDFATAQAEAVSSNRRLLVLFTGSDWCPPCMQFEAEVAHAPDFLNLARPAFVLVKLDYPRKTPQEPAVRARNEELRKQYGVKAYPTLLVISADGAKSSRVDTARPRRATGMVDYFVQAVDETRRAGE